MSKHLTIIRIGILASGPEYFRQTTGSELLSAFYEQAYHFSHLFNESRPFLPDDLPPIEIFPTPFGNEEEITLGGQDNDGQNFESLVASIPGRDVPVSVDGVDWVMRRSALIHLTAAVDRLAAPTIIWMSIEGIPNPKSSELFQDTKAQFVDFVNKHERENIRLAQRCYRDSMSSLGTKEAKHLKFESGLIKIALTDNRTRPVASLVDAVYFDKVAFPQLTEMNNKLLREGLCALEDFASHAAPNGNGQQSYNPENLSVESAAPDIKAIVSKRLDFPNYTSLIVGLARRTGDGGGYQEVLEELDREYPASLDDIRAGSPARRLSEQLALSEARLLDQRRLRFAP